MDGRLTAYRAALDFLFARTTGKTRLGLERTEALLEALGAPHRRLRAFHVAGTNGKGSTCATLDALLRGRGHRVGRYTSPHLVDFRERIVVDGAAITEAAVVAWVERWTPTCERLGTTFFEATTAMALDHFARAEVDVAVVEVGLGGRLDSTNVVTPLAAGVTAIGLDHVDLLGDSLEGIAVEKAGIFKPGRPAVIGEGNPALVRVLEREAASRGATPVVVTRDAWPVSDVAVGAGGTRFTLARGAERATLETPLVGPFQAENAALAIAMLDAAGADWAVPSLEGAASALRVVHLPGRFDRRGRWLFDVAHNPAGAEALAATMRTVGPARPVVALLTILADKDWRGIVAALAPVVDTFVITRAPTAPASRAWDADEAYAHARAAGWRALLEPDFDRALDLAASLGETVLVTGSFHTVGDAMTRLQMNPLDR